MAPSYQRGGVLSQHVSSRFGKGWSLNEKLSLENFFGQSTHECQQERSGVKDPFVLSLFARPNLSS